MVNKCKKGYKIVGKTCVSIKDKKRFGKFADEFYLLRIVLISAITSIGGWAIFKSLTGIFGLEDLNNWILLLIGIIVLISTYKFGWKKVIN